MKKVYQSLFIVGLAIAGLVGCESRNDKIQSAVEDGNKAIAAQQAQSQKEVDKAVVKAHEERVGAATEVAEAQRIVEEKKIESLKVASAAQAKVDQEKLEAEKKISETTHDAERKVESAAKP